MKTGLYCHIPFCASTCDFCAFYQEKPIRSDLNAYLSGMDLEFKTLGSNQSIDTIFWGGGTPSLLPAKDLERLGKSMLQSINHDFKEWTVEMAPSTVKKDKLAVLKAMGVTRLSLGVQSFDQDLLTHLGRLHNPNQIYKAWELIDQLGIENTNIDLMFALPNQTLDQLASDLKEAHRLGASHISTYCLTFEEDTALYVKLSQGKLKLDVERERMFYEFAWDTMKSLGFEQYEISNFSNSKETQCLHNLNTWKMNNWIGCGPSAASQVDKVRYRNTSSISSWLNGLRSNIPVREEEIKLTESILFIDSLVFGLRMNQGINLSALKAKYPTVTFFDSIDDLMNRLVDEGYLNCSGDRFVLTREGQLKCDAIGSELMQLG